ncbi:hypothetical protein EVAR_63117_1 [Eumeta japonica]|uniref:Uncharacterized protein n=1 Tax=Eumeta variegata TaxID=151549 RepID=A0A4C2A3D4_EUMVA|nr:hypothetical protein EVAR_63117_1 [Eumeta japonica]
MDENTERLGIGFRSPWGKSSVSLSPGFANLINGSTRSGCLTTPIDSWGYPVKDSEEISGSGRLEANQTKKETKTARRKSKPPRNAPRPVQDRKTSSVHLTHTYKVKGIHQQKVSVRQQRTRKSLNIQRFDIQNRQRTIYQSQGQPRGDQPPPDPRRYACRKSERPQ